MKAPYLRVGYFGAVIKDGIIPPDTTVFLDWCNQEVYHRVGDTDEWIKQHTGTAFTFIDLINLIAYKVAKKITVIEGDFVFQDLISLQLYDWNNNQLSIKLPISPSQPE